MRNIEKKHLKLHKTLRIIQKKPILYYQKTAPTWHKRNVRRTTINKWRAVVERSPRKSSANEKNCSRKKRGAGGV